MDICRRTGTNYLWIDSLCIVQDSADDWKEESVKMGSIYQNAAFTIAATKSSDGNGGCYSSIRASELPHSKLVPGTYGVRVRPHHGISLPSRFHARLSQTLKEWPLLSRAWVYQEMHLSRRVLHFCHGEVFWQCRQLTRGLNSGEQSVDSGSSDAVPQAITASAQEWHGIVHNYSSLMLTYPSDRLPALSAIAEQTMQLRDPEDRYLAGLWEKTLLLDLQWFRADTNAEEGGKYKGVRVVSTGMPSWSWASVDVRVAWKNYDLLPGDIFGAVELVKVNCEANGPAILGNYHDTQLVFRGPLLRTTLTALYTRPCRIIDERMYGSHLDVEWFQPDYGYDAPGPGHLPRETVVYLMPLAVVETGSFSLCHSLVLMERSVLETRPCYERVGFARLEDSVQMRQLMQSGLQLPEDVDAYFDDAKKRFETAFKSLPQVEIVVI